MIDIHAVIRFLSEYTGPEIKIMEVCGTHTAAIFTGGIRSFLSPHIHLVSGPGCPVCVTPSSYIDRAIHLAMQDHTTVLSFGDMIRVPGTHLSLGEAKAEGASVELLYSPMDIVEKAQKHPEITFIMAAVGFETTIPAYTLLLDEMLKKRIVNIKLLPALKTILPAMEWICIHSHSIDAFLCPGHVSAIIGSTPYILLAEQYHKPCAIAGFSTELILLAIYDLLKQIKNGKAEVHNLYPSVVTAQGNQKALQKMQHYLLPSSGVWRGLGKLEHSCLVLRDIYQEYDASVPENQEEYDAELSTKDCRCGDVITGTITPDVCPAFGKNCTPSHPLGACMVSAEGACSIYIRYRIL